ncbi:tRNA (adenosine(37)-N6)-dimethylallyltransferase MiaA [Euzebya rosea]|uniref:tRNA (adenosine(37)-N6)-dimethylallyltransferase MiaA n=1 Tax=Euzebya rosea TaxID=2052804 RepID=UPI000D3E2077|nr:tRNA (adenosine(37)-N6)-dimethylallyltransferase MiaA [Euzebya rosea]
MEEVGPDGPTGPVVAVVGPTGSGKSAAAMAAADRLHDAGHPVELVAIDAFTVYRGLDIGTATPGPEDRARVPHHLVDELEPDQDCTVRWFQQRARTAIADVIGRGALPLLVGGSGLYYRAVVDAMVFPPTDPAVRERLEGEWAHDPAAAHQHLAALDPEAAGRIDPLNLRRTVRALEVIELTSQPFSSFHRVWQSHESIYPGLSVIGVDVDRRDLADRLERRTHRMLEDGWLDEAAALRDRTLSDTARQAIGYAELFAHLDGEMTLEDATERIVIRTRQFAAKQRRWFRKDPRIQWQPADAVPAAVEAAARLG